MTSYTRPSQCQQCWPEVTHNDYVTEYAHEAECPNNPRKDNDIHGK